MLEILRRIMRHGFHHPTKIPEGSQFSRPPEPLPADRRSLTPPPTAKDRRKNEQPQSPLFSILTLDARLLIYEEILAPPGDEVLHVGSTDKRLCGFRCRETKPNLRGWQHDCWPTMAAHDGTIWGALSRRYPDPEVNILHGLLCSCQRVYSESIDILYTGNVIHVRQTRPISEFPLVIVPHRLAMIKHLHLDTRLYYEWDGGLRPGPWPADVLYYWNAARDVIGTQMPGLQTFRVSFGISSEESSPINDNTLAKLLESLRPITHVPEFQVDFHWQRNLDTVLERLGISQGDLPFKITVYDIGGQSRAGI